MVMDDVAIRRHRMHRAQERMNSRFQVLRADRRQPPYSHPVMPACGNGRSEIASAIHRDFVSQSGQFMPGLLVIGLDTAVLRANSAPSNESDPYAATLARVFRRSRERYKLLRRDEPVLDVEQLIHVSFGIVIPLRALARRGAHLLN